MFVNGDLELRDDFPHPPHRGLRGQLNIYHLEQCFAYFDTSAASIPIHFSPPPTSI